MKPIETSARRGGRLLIWGVAGLALWLAVAHERFAHAQSGAPWSGEDSAEPPPPSPYPPGQEPSAADNLQEDPAQAQELEASFEPSLSPYGTWAQDPTYGRVWMPSPDVVGDSFVPYASNGHWVYSEFGWTWVSGWDWGWAPFHYGRWAHLGGNGPWCWVPGTAWSPAWVAWRSGGGFAGWAALAPRNAVMDPATWRTSWVFVRDFDLGEVHPSYQTGMRAPELYRQTAPVRDTRLVTVGARQMLVNPGPATRGASAAAVVFGAPAVPGRAGAMAPAAAQRGQAGFHAAPPAFPATSMPAGRRDGHGPAFAPPPASPHAPAPAAARPAAIPAPPGPRGPRR